MTTDIPIQYVNATGKTDFEVVVFTKNFSTKTPKVYYAAWEILKAQTQEDFVYPVAMAVGAYYESRGKTIIAGPFPAELGSTWDITQETIESTATLKKKSGTPNPNGTIVIQNVKPATWSGRKFDIGIYKSGKLLIVQKDVHISDQVDFMLKPKLYFGVVSNMHVGDVFISLDITTALKEFDLSQFPNGMVVTLNESPVGGQYRFSAAPM